MNKVRKTRRAKAIALAGLMAIGCFLGTIRADASDISVDPAGHSNPEITHTYVYRWVEGLPPVNDDTLGVKYPTLMTWDDTYYVQFTHDVANQMMYHINGNGTDSMLNGWSTNKKDSGYVNGSFDADGQYPHGYFLQNAGYPGSKLSELKEIDFSLLTSKGSFITLEIPKCIPNVIPALKPTTYLTVGQITNNPMYAIEVDIPEDDYWYYASNHIGEQGTDGGMRRGENYIVGMRRNMNRHWTTKEHFLGIPYTEHHVSSGWYWSLYGLNSVTAYHLYYNAGWNDYVNFKRSDYSFLGDISYFKTTTTISSRWHFCWYAPSVTQNGKKYYAFWNKGSYIDGLPHTLCDEMDDYDEAVDLSNRDAKVGLAHYSGNFESRGNWDGDTVLNAFNKDKGKCQYAFRCFYAEPLLMNYAQKSFTVEKGQVYNLDGPMFIGRNCTITVKDGGTLTVTGWVMNNGSIKVEKGGTLYMQDNSSMNRFNDGTTGGGSVIVNGLVLVGKNAKLIGGGDTGLMFNDGSHAVNYGCIASENFIVSSAYTIENRGSGFVLYGPGNGVTNSGNFTYETPLSGKTFAERGTVLSNAYAYLVSNAIYKGND